MPLKLALCIQHPFSSSNSSARKKNDCPTFDEAFMMDLLEEIITI